MNNQLVEIWEDIPSLEGYYQASNLGRIKSISRFVKTKYQAEKWHCGKIIKPIRKSSGYLKVNLSSEGVRKTFSIHQLIAITFLDNYNNYNSINHKNGNKADNSLSNLEWCTIAYNNLHAYRNLGKRNPMQGIKGKLNPNSKPVFCIDTNERFDSINQASESFGVLATSIARVCKGINHKVGGLKFKYA